MFTFDPGEEGEDKFLVAYVVLEPSVRPRKLRKALKARLPHYCIPAFIVPLAEIPISAAGKLEKRRLPAVDRASYDEGADDDIQWVFRAPVVSTGF
mgnify:CR=1 FL=1